MMTFWAGWQSWEQMVFILACAMVIVIIVGGFVAWFNRWKMRFYTQASTEMADRAQTMYRQEYGQSDVLFGARALESGVLVEGIYNPTQQTPPRDLTSFKVDSSSINTPSPSPPRAPRSQQRRYTAYTPF
ncbi:hypothetical protein BGW36DRAFT_35719 [Talaromyces proteolyticus]|uniref:Uncharacterized protein n=1 Tax=Talaromyces proteolyticus TaxID=1131652 RepID=A0AAD4KQG4_9EURO|nr:uncharacterized protein BGW36DRAFT_35719 [Talaromyces proteolyticus]KAH8693174.1 hypothetical protein BGW36DRAFT_35719 [Talaromyces proteolyticus]